MYIQIQGRGDRNTFTSYSRYRAPERETKVREGSRVLNLGDGKAGLRNKAVSIEGKYRIS
jgi:hypothetical protein